MYSIVQEVDPMALEAAGVKRQSPPSFVDLLPLADSIFFTQRVLVIIIGNGDPKVIHSYQGKVFSCPFPVYTDPTLECAPSFFHNSSRLDD